MFNTHTHADNVAACWLGGLIVALSVGLFFGTYPASKAA